MRTSLFAAALLVLFVLPARAAEQRTEPRLAPAFEGRIVDAVTGQGTAGVLVLLRNDRGEAARTTADADGRFAMQARPGAYVLEIGGRMGNAVTVAEQGGASTLTVLLPDGASAGALSPFEWVMIGGGLAAFAAPVVTMIAVSGNGLSVSP